MGFLLSWGCFTIILFFALVFLAVNPWILGLALPFVIWFLFSKVAKERRKAEAQKVRGARIAAIEANPVGHEIYRAELDRIAPGWRATGQASIVHIDHALALAEERLGLQEQRRQARIASVEAKPDELKVYHRMLDELEPGWRDSQRASTVNIDRALDAAQGSDGG